MTVGRVSVPASLVDEFWSWSLFRYGFGRLDYLECQQENVGSQMTDSGGPVRRTI